MPCVERNRVQSKDEEGSPNALGTATLMRLASVDHEDMSDIVLLPVVRLHLQCKQDGLRRLIALICSHCPANDKGASLRHQAAHCCI